MLFASYRVWRNERRFAYAQVRDAGFAKEREIEALRLAKDQEIESLKVERDALKNRPYDDDHKRLAEDKVNKLSEASKDLVHFLLHHGKTEGADLEQHCLHMPQFNEAVQRARGEALVLASQTTGNQGRSGIKYFWEVNPHFEPVLQDLLGKREPRYFR
jgi:hypothetical protein